MDAWTAEKRSAWQEKGKTNQNLPQVSTTKKWFIPGIEKKALHRFVRLPNTNVSIFRWKYMIRIAKITKQMEGASGRPTTKANVTSDGTKY